MCERKPGRVSAERNAGAVPVGDGTLVVREQRGWEEVDQERDVTCGTSCERIRGQLLRWESGSSDGKGGRTLEGHHVCRVPCVVELALCQAQLLALFRALAPALDPPEVALALDLAVPVVALVERDDKEVLCALLAVGGALLVRVLDEAVGKAVDEGVVGPPHAAVQEEEHGEVARPCARLCGGEFVEAVDGDREPADVQRSRHGRNRVSRTARVA